ncbi:Transposon Tf2-8 polyprotein [Labeo rohita]|uniref:ribonuclease H n=1 Tax=Labeo rohita TaxID=84645 RepID=A0ABQ8L084_LABRO|nr:Transposon Tf2-8 polyprotein [Labeo rohita]
MNTEEAPAPNPSPFTELISAFQAAISPPQPPPSASGRPMALPTLFAREAAECSGFLLQVQLYICMQPQQFPIEDAKVAFLTSLLTGKALRWAKAIWNADNPIFNSFEQFTSHFSEVFSTTTSVLTVSDQLQQGSSSVHDYTIHFRTLAAASGWNEIALLGAFRQGLNPDIRAAMVLYDDSIGLEAFLQRTAWVSQRLAACQPPRNRSSVRYGGSLLSGTRTYATRFFKTFPNRTSTSPHFGIMSRLPPPVSVPLPLASTRIESPEVETTVEIPAEYLEYQDVFSKQAATHLPPHQPWDCAIDLLPGAQLPKGRVYPLSNPERQAMEEYVKEALAQGFIQPSTSPATSSFFFVGKKDGGLRPCIDYRQLNSQIIQQPYPLPLVPATLEELRGARIFTKLDLRSAYNLVCIRAGDEWKTAFITPTGHYEYLVMPYGLSISPSVFQTFMNKVFREFLHQFVVVYIDDILIYFRNQAEHRQHVRQVLQVLRQHHLYLKLEKCELHQPEVQFLGYNISPEGVHMNHDKVLAIQKWPQPNTIKELQRFLGFTNFYCRFIKDYSSITSPLTSLLRGHPKRLCWNPSAHDSFQQLKKIFSTAPLLRHPDPERPFVVEVDASTIGVGAVLSQAAGDSSPLHPCAYFSNKLSPAAQNYDVGNQELLSIKLALEEWRHWLEGAKHPFLIITDHKNLQYLREAKRLNPHQARWALFFTRFQFKITYRPGSKNIPADALSRQFSENPVTESEPIIPPDLIVSPIQWDIDTWGSMKPLSKSLLRRNVQKARSTYPAPNVNAFWTQFTNLRALDTQVAEEPSRSFSLVTGKLMPLPIPQRPWSHLGIDFVTDLPNSEGNTCVLVIVDRFSKACKFIPLRGLPTAMDTAEMLFQHIFCHFGLPEEIVSDQGPQFISHVWKAFFKSLGVSVHLSSGYHPQTNGQTERKIQELGRYLRSYCSEDQHSWSRFLPWAEYAQNSLRQDTTGLTPFQCVLSFQPPLFPWTEEPTHVPAVDYWFRESERVWDSAHRHLQRTIRRHKADARRRDTPIYHPGDKVWLSMRDIWLKLPCRKLSPRYIGPFEILRQINEVTYQLQLPPRYRIHPTFHVSLLKPYFPSATGVTGAEAEPPPPEILDQPSVYSVHEILDSRRRGGHLEYLVDWEGYGPEERSWVARNDILDPQLLTDFHQSHPERLAPRGRGRPRHRRGGGNVRVSPQSHTQPHTLTTPPEDPPNRSRSPDY